MPITAAQRTKRKSHLGSSDMAVLFGLSPFQSEYDLWLEKTDQLEDTGKAKEWLEQGNDFEAVILARAERELGKLLPNQYRSAKARGLPLASNMDAIVVETGNPVEAKTCGVWWPAPETWGEAGTDQVPDRVIIQAHVHMICAERDLCHVPAMFWGLRQSMYHVGRSEEIVKQIEELAVAWWDRHVVQGVEPDASAATMRTIPLRKRAEKKSVALPEGVAHKLVLGQEMKSGAEKFYEAAKALALHCLGDAEIGTFEIDGKPQELTYFEVSRAGYTVEPATFRQSRIRKAKTEKE